MHTHPENKLYTMPNASQKMLIKVTVFTGLDIKKTKTIFLFLNQNRCCGYSKDPSFEHPKHVKKCLKLLCPSQFRFQLTS